MMVLENCAHSDIFISIAGHQSLFGWREYRIFTALYASIHPVDDFAHKKMHKTRCVDG